ncbi:glycogen debranching protein GlgX [Arthrobacter rhombi]|uniref:glycogen debranching protein GlgX n=1 Tax=Arthrobacter rhombi TaxID=71253 RepID=UPI003FD3B95A
MNHSPATGTPRREPPVGESTALVSGISAAVPVPGAEAVDDSVNVAVFAPDLESVDIHYTDPSGQLVVTVLTGHTGQTHHGLVKALRPGASYAFWAHGADLPGDGQLLLDPYARAIVEDDDGALWGVHVSEDFDWGGDAPPQVPWRNTVIYEAHVRGQSMLHPDVPEELRGTYAGMAHPSVVAHLLSLGVTAVELLPIHFHLDEPHLQDLGLPNYWGYNTLGFFAPHGDYASAAARKAGPAAVRDELKGMIRLLHQAGLEVILDVVYNHTAEGGADQKTYSWRGLGNLAYYRHDEAGNYVDTTGCGNTLDFSTLPVIEMALASLRHWVADYHIDGFRFDLAVTLGRDEENRFTPHHPFLEALSADPLLSRVKLIAEPWDVGFDGWQTGRFNGDFADWNDGYRDTVREFWVSGRGALDGGGQAPNVARLASVLAGSRETFAASGRGPLASINLVTAHDGFTLRDLVSHDRKHNEANGESNRDGSDDNRSYNHGVEGMSADEAIDEARLQTASNVMGTLLLSLGVPMITAGDEFGKTQRGNNNAYCQDNELSWLDWTPDAFGERILRRTKAFSKIRREFLQHQPFVYPTIAESSYLLWLNAEGVPMRQEEWTDGGTRLVQLLMGSASGSIDGLIIFNGHLDDQQIRLPAAESLKDFRPSEAAETSFELRYGTATDIKTRQGTVLTAGDQDFVQGNSISVYRCEAPRSRSVTTP